MATFIFTWELGFGLGHLVNLRPLAEGLSVRGHRVALALRDLSRAKAIFQGQNIEYWQAPCKTRATRQIASTLSFAHILYDAGYCDLDELAGMCEAWRSIFRAVDPDVIVFDHSPTALLAARPFRAKRVTLGTGFFCPLDESPLQCLQPWLKADTSQAARDEEEILHRMNRLLAVWNQPPLARVAGLFHPSDEHLLATFAELDHYQGRTGARYWGAWSSGFGKPPQWPDGSGKRIYAYLKPFQELPKLLDVIKRSACPAIVYCDGIPAQLQRQFQAPTVRFENEPLDIQRAARECDLAILNANHGTAVVMLLAGKPLLLIPIHVEQALLAGAIMRMDAGLGASPTSSQEIEGQFGRLLAGNLCVAGARQFATRYASFDADRQLAAIVERLEALAL
ncbi:MAG: hypothetical protein WD063_17850 [Pirellulales bacterium]